MKEELCLFVMWGYKSLAVYAQPCDTVKQIKETIQRVEKLPVLQQSLVMEQYPDMILQDDHTLADYEMTTTATTTILLLREEPPPLPFPSSSPRPYCLVEGDRRIRVSVKLGSAIDLAVNTINVFHEPARLSTIFDPKLDRVIVTGAIMYHRAKQKLVFLPNDKVPVGRRVHVCVAGVTDFYFYTG